MYGGRWNNKDTYIVYTAQSRALALLEAVVHIGRVPNAGYCMAAIDISDSSIEVFPAEKLPAGWDKNPSPDFLKTIGDHFIKTGKHLALQIPSVVMPEEYNYLLNPAHVLFAKVRISMQRSIGVDYRLFATQ